MKKTFNSFCFNSNNTDSQMLCEWSYYITIYVFSILYVDCKATIQTKIIM